MMSSITDPNRTPNGPRKPNAEDAETTPFEPLSIYPVVESAPLIIDVTPTQEPPPVEQIVEPAQLPVKPCPRCGGPVDVRTRHLAIRGSLVRAYCSRDCATATDPMIIADPPVPRARKWLRALGHLSLGVPMLFFASGPGPKPVEQASAPVATIAGVIPAPAAPAPEPAFGPSWPPSEKDWQAEIAADAWVHPLDGPMRRMPKSDSRVFGAERPGDRPGECRSGHCGVDLGGEMWGEPVHAAHDGVVDRVQRGPNEEHGGQYVRLAHREGTIFTQYFHLAAIPRWVQPGVKIKVGDVVGLLGDTGVKHSQYHLHFTVSVKPSKELVEEYIDPEPLIALWPIRLPVSPNSTVAAISAHAEPGLVRGANRGHKKKKKVIASDSTAPAPTDDVNPTE
jgi:murein DD-endopeptidase MepM/ murein hydrolase activator NlpD